MYLGTLATTGLRGSGDVIKILFLCVHTLPVSAWLHYFLLQRGLFQVSGKVSISSSPSPPTLGLEKNPREEQ